MVGAHAAAGSEEHVCAIGRMTRAWYMKGGMHFSVLAEDKTRCCSSGLCFDLGPGFFTYSLGRRAGMGHFDLLLCLGR